MSRSDHESSANISAEEQPVLATNASSASASLASVSSLPPDDSPMDEDAESSSSSSEASVRESSSSSSSRLQSVHQDSSSSERSSSLSLASSSSSLRSMNSDNETQQQQRTQDSSSSSSRGAAGSGNGHTTGGNSTANSGSSQMAGTRASLSSMSSTLSSASNSADAPAVSEEEQDPQEQEPKQHRGKVHQFLRNYHASHFNLAREDQSASETPRIASSSSNGSSTFQLVGDKKTRQWESDLRTGLLKLKQNAEPGPESHQIQEMLDDLNGIESSFSATMRRLQHKASVHDRQAHVSAYRRWVAHKHQRHQQQIAQEAQIERSGRAQELMGVDKDATGQASHRTSLQHHKHRHQATLQQHLYRHFNGRHSPESRPRGMHRLQNQRWQHRHQQQFDQRPQRQPPQEPNEGQQGFVAGKDAAYFARKEKERKIWEARQAANAQIEKRDEDLISQFSVKPEPNLAVTAPAPVTSTAVHAVPTAPTLSAPANAAQDQQARAIQLTKKESELASRDNDLIRQFAVQPEPSLSPAAVQPKAASWSPSPKMAATPPEKTVTAGPLAQGETLKAKTLADQSAVDQDALANRDRDLLSKFAVKPE